MEKPKFLKESNGARNVNRGPLPMANPEFTQGGAPGGPFFNQSELPVKPLGESGKQSLPVKLK